MFDKDNGDSESTTRSRNNFVNNKVSEMKNAWKDFSCIGYDIRYY